MTSPSQASLTIQDVEASESARRFPMAAPAGSVHAVATPPRAMRMLVSVRSVAEAVLVAHSGADFIDLKEPSAGALGGLPLSTIRAIVDALREQDPGWLLSATVGDLAMGDVAAILRRVELVAACGVDYVKVGITPDPGAGEVLDALSRCGQPVVPVFIADSGLDAALVTRACSAHFPAVMVDTSDKKAGSLFGVATTHQLRDFVTQVREAGSLVGLAGALRLSHLPQLVELAPDFAGFRSAVCAGDRSGALDPERLRGLVAQLRGATRAESGAGR